MYFSVKSAGIYQFDLLEKQSENQQNGLLHRHQLMYQYLFSTLSM